MATLFDLKERALSSQVWSRLVSAVAYDTVGQPVASTTGGRIYSVSWKALGFPSRVRRADGAVVTYQIM